MIKDLSINPKTDKQNVFYFDDCRISVLKEGLVRIENDSKKKSSEGEVNSEEEQKKLSEQERKANELREQIRKVLEIPDSEYKDSMITSDMRRFIKQVDEEYTTNIADFKSHIAPSYWEYKSNIMNISGIL